MTQNFSVALQDGFADDDVVVYCNDREVARHAALRTDLRTGFATSFDLRDQAVPIRLRVELTNLQVAAELRLFSEHCPFVGISRVGNHLRFDVSASPFGYV